MKRPLQVGITGGIGTGKTLVSRIFHCLGIPIYDADSRAKSLMNSDAGLIADIQNEFGQGAYGGDGKIDRAFLAKSSFGKPEKLEALNKFVHPRVAEDYSAWMEENSQSPYLIREAALLYEAGAYKTVDKMMVVSSPLALRVRRIMQRDPQRSEEEIRNIIESQWPEEEKLKRADYIILNDDENMIIPQVLSLHERFRS